MHEEETFLIDVKQAGERDEGFWGDFLPKCAINSVYLTMLQHALNHSNLGHFQGFELKKKIPCPNRTWFRITFDHFIR